MGRQTNRLTTRGVASLKKVGRHADGGNLYLTISRTAVGLSKRWTFMYSFAGKQREAGFGPASSVTLAEVREKAAEWRSQLAKGIDPLASAKAASEAKKASEARQTFGQCAEALFKSKKPGWRAGKHASDWRRSVTDYCGAILDLPVEQVTTGHVLAVLSPLWGRIPETASRLRGRIEAVLDSAKAKGLRSGENPAAWRGHLALILPKRPKISKVHHPALAYSDVPAFIAKLRENESLHAPALEFIILTAARSAEALGARWAEIDLASKVWTIPAGRMKAGLAHRVPLSGRAIEIVEKQAATRNNDFLFPGVRIGRPLGPSSLRKLHPPGGTIHGFRSSFRDWAGEETQFPREVAEAALAHASGDATERAYRRGDALEKRRGLMEAWSSYCAPRPAANVVKFKPVQNL